MNGGIAFCGLSCDECGAYIATVNDDDARRAEVAATWSKEYGADIEPSGINCLGCHSTGEPIFAHCRVCEIRLCGLERGIDNCAHCDDYACEKLAEFLEMVPACRKTLDAIRKGG